MADFFTSYKQKLKEKDALTVLMTINLVIFLLFTICRIAYQATQGNEFFAAGLMWLDQVFSFRTDLGFFLTHPWTIVTSIFTHYTFEHIFFNMLMFYFTAEMFVYFFGKRKLVWVYLLGGIAGNLLELLTGIIMNPGAEPISIIGASGSVMAVFMTIALYQPKMKVKLFGLLEVKIIYLAVFYFLWDFTRIGFNDGIAHFAHLGGALIGFLSAKGAHLPTNILNRVDRLWLSWSSKKEKKTKMKKPVYGGRPMTDEAYNAKKKEEQDRMDKILDKVAKSGYDGLTAAEKEFLFNESNKRR